MESTEPGANRPYAFRILLGTLVAPFAALPIAPATGRARVLDAAAVGSDPDGGSWVVAHVQRTTMQTYDAGRVVHELADDEGNVAT